MPILVFGDRIIFIKAVSIANEGHRETYTERERVRERESERETERERGDLGRGRREMRDSK